MSGIKSIHVDVSHIVCACNFLSLLYLCISCGIIHPSCGVNWCLGSGMKLGSSPGRLYQGKRLACGRLC